MITIDIHQLLSIHKVTIIVTNRIVIHYKDNNMENQKCSSCKRYQSLSSFRIDDSFLNGIDCYCKACRTDTEQKFINKSINAYRHSFEYNMKKNYSLTLFDYAYMRHIVQDNKCACCHNELNDVRCSHAVDHNHITGKVRAIVCRRCNTAIGYIETSDLNKLIEYINKYT